MKFVYKVSIQGAMKLGERSPPAAWHQSVWQTMKIEQPLSGLFEGCMTLCVSECCGIEAYDFHPVHIASELLRHRGHVDENQLANLRTQLESLESDYGPAGKRARGTSLEGVNQSFTGQEVASRVHMISTNLEIAVQLISTSDKERVDVDFASGG